MPRKPKTAEVTLDIITLAREYRELGQKVKDLEVLQDTIKATLIAEMDRQGIDCLSADILTVKYSTYMDTRLDTVTLKAENPELVAKYTKSIERRRFQII